MRRFLVVFAVSLILAACGSRSSRTPRCGNDARSHIVSDVLSNNTVTSFAEDAQGHLWIATERGLNRFNVNEYHQYFSDSTCSALRHNNIRHLYRDRNDNLWVGTLDGVSRYTNTDIFESIPIEELSQNAIQFFEDNDGRLFLNMNVHLCEFDREKGAFVSRIHDFDPGRLFDARCYVDRKNLLWVVNPLLLRSFKTSTMEAVDSLRLEDGYYTASALDDRGMLWLASYGKIRVFDVNLHRFVDTPRVLASNERLRKLPIGILHVHNDKIIGVADRNMFIYDPAADSIVFDDEVNFPFKAPRFNISTLYSDREGNLWIGSGDQGYTVIYSQHDRFSNYLSTFFKNTSVVSMANAGDNIVILTLNGEIYLYNRKANTQPQRSAVLPAGVKPYSLRADNEGFVWLMTRDRVFKTRLENGELVRVADYEAALPTTVAQDRNGTVWLSSYTPYIHALRKGETSFSPIQIRPLTFTFTSDLETLADGRVMAVTFDYPFLFIDPDNRTVVQSAVGYHNTRVPLFSSKFTPTCLFQDSRNAVWVGTIGNGLLRYDCAADSLERVDDISCTDISDVREDNFGNIWISTKYGLNKYDYTTGKVSHFYISDGIGGNQFYQNCSLKFDDGTLMFGGTHGITVFNPSEITPRRNVGLLFENLRVHNELIIPYNSECVDRLLSLNPEVTLSSDQNSFSLSFVALEYGEFERRHYMYMLEGVDPHWIDAGNNREVFFSNLAPGKYKFRVRAMNPDKDEVEAENVLSITVEPSPFFSWWAKFIYVLLLAAALWFVYHVWSRIKKEKEHARFAEQEKLQEKKVNEMNMSFFANISHEFRTPLTLIAGPVAELSENKNLSEADRNLMTVVKRNVSRMQRLVNQILDFHKLENDTLRLQVEEADAVAIVKGVVETFVYTASRKGITMVCYGVEDSFRSLVDADKIEKITYNLLSNALKYTPTGGQIEVSFDVVSNAVAVALMPELREHGPAGSDYIKISVADNGPGFPEKQLHKVFERYYQCEDDGRYNWGTGIGLYYARKLALIHHGYLIAANRSDSQGAVLTLCIPVGESVFTAAERVKRESAAHSPVVVDAPADAAGDVNAGDDTGRKRVLVVDDDADIAHYIKSLLAKNYNVMTCGNAAEALDALADFTPDLVISDVVMPGGSGFDLCRDIKESTQHCHIPVILLTAKHTVDEQVQGLDSGADAYVTKPFEPTYLLAMVRTTLDNRNRLREMLTTSTSTESAPSIENELAPHDKKFIDEIYAIMESELSNSELDIVEVLDRLKISRTKLYYKLKGLTGHTPASFFKIYKLNRAAEFIREGRHSISEIADLTGFSTLSHFSTSFKKHFGVAPSDFV